MIRKSDWQAVNDELTAEDRNTLGEPPTAEEMMAYTMGELSEEKAARIQRLLVAYPELASTLTHPFPADEAKPGDDDFLSDEQIAQRWTSLRDELYQPAAVSSSGRELPQGRNTVTQGSRVTDRPDGRAATSGAGARPMGRVLQFSPVFAALAATLALVFGGLLWRANLQLAAPRVPAEEQFLFPEGQRGPGGEETILTTDSDTSLLVVPISGGPDFPSYRLDLVEGTKERVLWSATGLQRRSNDVFAVTVPHAFLRPGPYKFILYGVDGARSQRLNVYRLRMPAE